MKRRDWIKKLAAGALFGCVAGKVAAAKEEPDALDLWRKRMDELLVRSEIPDGVQTTMAEMDNGLAVGHWEIKNGSVHIYEGSHIVRWNFHNQRVAIHGHVIFEDVVMANCIVEIPEGCLLEIRDSDIQGNRFLCDGITI